jgi:hypothetical protein
MAGKITLDLTDDNDILVSVEVLSKLPVVSSRKGNFIYTQIARVLIKRF